jgi:hypothetical protein
MSWWNTIREGAEDAFNNMVGAGIGVMPGLTDAEKIQMIQRLSYANKLPDGYDYPLEEGKPPNMYFKQYGGAYEEIELTDKEVAEYRKGGHVVEELPKAQSGRSIPVSDPNDPRLHMYLDSLNLYKGYQKAQELFPEKPYKIGYETRWSTIRDNARATGRKKELENIKYYDPNFADPNTKYWDSFDEYWRNDAKRDQIREEEYTDATGRVDWEGLEKDPRMEKLHWNKNMEAFKTIKDLRQDDTNSGDLAQYYADELTFKHPTSVGYWHSPDLGSSKIPPVDSYWGEAWNPIYEKPVQPYEYTGDPADVNKLRYPAKISGVSKWQGKPTGTTDPKFSVAVNLRKRGMDSSFAARKKMAEEAGIENYKGTKEQNIALNDYVFTNYEGDKKKTSEGTGGNKTKMEGLETFPVSGLKAIREIVATPDPEAQVEAQRKTAEGKAPRVISYTQEWDPVAKKWTQQPVIQEIAVAPGQYQKGGEYKDLDDAEADALRAQGYIVEELPKAQVGYNTPEYNEAYNQGTVTRYNPQTDTLLE